MNPIQTDAIEPFLEKLRAKEPAVFLALSDSNTDNTSFTRGAKQWPELLHTELKMGYETQRLLLVNSGISGDTIRNALDRFETDVAAFRPAMTVVALGGNDAGQLSDEEFLAGLHECLDRLERLGSSVLLYTPAPIMERQPLPPHFWNGDDRLQKKAGAIRQVARARKVAFVDVYRAFRDLEQAGRLNVGELMADEVHLNAEGHRLLFRLLAPAFGLPATLHWERVPVKK